MGSVWCKADKKQQSRSFSPKIPFNSTTITKWTNQVCQAYKRPKDGRRPARPQRPSSRSGERPSISHPHPITEDMNKGWQSATLVVPEYTPVPPPRKKRKRKLQELERNARSMNHLNRSGMFDNSTISLPDRIETEEFSRSSSTFIVRPILENDDYEVLRKYDSPADDKENMTVAGKTARDLDQQQMYYEIPHSTYVDNKPVYLTASAIDKLSDISEEYIHVDDMQNVQSKNNREVPPEVLDAKRGEMNILQHIYNISNVSKMSNANEDISDCRARPKSAWLRNILATNETADDPDHRKNPERLPTRSDRGDRFHLMNGEEGVSAPDAGNKTPPTTPTREFTSEPAFSFDRATTHSVLLEILKRNKLNEKKESTRTDESIFQSNIRTNVIYKSSSTDKLADETYINTFPKSKTLEPIPSKYEHIKSNSKSYILTPPLYRRHTYHSDTNTDSYNPFQEYKKQNHVSKGTEQSQSGSSKQSVTRNPYLVQYKDYIGSTNRSYVSALRELELVEMKQEVPDRKKRGVQQTGDTKSADPEKPDVGKANSSNVNHNSNHQSSQPSSRKSSITDSLQEFEMSIYDMLKESKRQSDSSDDEEIKKAKQNKAPSKHSV